MIYEAIPYSLNQFAVFSDTLPVDDPTETLTVRPPVGEPFVFTYADFTRTVNTPSEQYPNGSFTFTRAVRLTQPSAWTGEFESSGGAADRVPVYAYVVDR